MKFLHTGDLHIGKTVNEMSMLEDQRHILAQIREIAVAEKVDALIIAGDVYDRPIPPTEAVELLDDFLTSVLEQGIQVIMISGNHDSAERVAFADRILEKQGLHIAGGYNGTLKRVLLTDEWGAVDFVCMPFVKPGIAGVEEMLSATPMVLDRRSRHVLITHYFVIGDNGERPELSDSETNVCVGGLDAVPASFFVMFDYVALGHIHKNQKIGKKEVWYAGSPLKYSFSEVSHQKSVNLVFMGEKGEITVETRTLKPLREMRILRGRLKELVSQAQEEYREDYIKAQLTDTEELIDPIGTLRSVYPRTMAIELEKLKMRTEKSALSLSVQDVSSESMEELFESFYELLCGERMDEKRREIVKQTAEACRKEGETA